MHRFFADKSQFEGDFVTLVGDDVKHISRVLRLSAGDVISVCNKEKCDYVCTLTEIGKDYARAHIDDIVPNTNESNIEITLYQGLPKGDKMDLIVQKSVELGAVRIVPVVMKRTVVKLKGSGKSDRWQRISEEASKQCMRGIVPEVEAPILFKDMLERIDDESLTILPYENERQSRLRDALAEGKNKINIIIGPEGGFDEAEVEACIDKGARVVTLGPRIMRCETAPIATISAVMYQLGDW